MVFKVTESINDKNKQRETQEVQQPASDTPILDKNAQAKINNLKVLVHDRDSQIEKLIQQISNLQIQVIQVQKDDWLPSQFRNMT